MKMFSDNKTSLILTKDPENQNFIKHIDIIYHHVCGLVEDGELDIKWILSSKILADGLTKAFPIGPLKDIVKNED